MRTIDDAFYKELLINSLAGKSVGGSIEYAVSMTKKGLAKFTGNQWNEDWTWIKEKLNKLTIEQLEKLYKNEQIDS